MISKCSLTHTFSSFLRKRIFPSLFLCFICIGVTHAQATLAAFLQDITGSATLTTNEQSKRTKIMTDASISSSWVVKVNSIENYLTGKHLSFTLPGTSRPIAFDADYVSSKTDGSYYWIGYSSDGSVFDISRFPDGSYHGSIVDAPNGGKYQLISLSTTRCILVKYAPGTGGSSSCTVEGYNESGDVENVTMVGDRTGCEVNLIRILFLHTPGADATGINPSNVAGACINQLQAAANTSGILLGSLNYLAVGVLPFSFTETNDIATDRLSVINSTTAQNLRNANHADLVVVLTASAYGTTLGTALPTVSSNDPSTPSTAFAIVVINAAVGPVGDGFTAVHEIGHLSATRHQVCNHSLCNVTGGGCSTEDVRTHGHLFPVNGATIRTITTQAQCGGTAIMRWSNPDVTFMGVATGNKFSNEASAIRLFAPHISCFRPAPPSGEPMFGLTIDGNPTVCSSSAFGVYSASVSSFNLVYPLTYSWEVSATGTGGFTQVGTGQQFILTSVAGLPNPFFLRVTVTDYGLRTSTTQRSISIVSCAGGGADDRAAPDVNAFRQTALYPNPTSGIVYFSTTKPSTRLKITDSNGRILQIVPTAAGTNWSFDLSNVPDGIYYLYATENASTRTFKVVKL